jgi:hypothetical protein
MAGLRQALLSALQQACSQEYLPAMRDLIATSEKHSEQLKNSARANKAAPS